jgi:hypothetical protein
MALGTCLTDLRDRGVITPERFERLRPQYEELILQYEKRYGRAAAEAMATEKVLKLAESDLVQRKRQAFLQEQAQAKIAEKMRKAGERAGKPIHKRGIEQILVDMDGLRQSIRRQSFQMLYGLLEKQRKDLVGRVRNPAELDAMRRELWGEDTGNLNAKEIAQAWRETSEWLRSRFNAAGGHIAKLDLWRLPQTHDMRRINDAGFDAWRAFVLGKDAAGNLRLDRAQMKDYTTGEPMSDARLEFILKDMYESITTDGWSRNKPGEFKEGALANRHADHRVLHFATADAWQEYAENFGGAGNAFDAMIAHVEAMSRDIAQLETMGTNPRATLAFMQAEIDNTAKMAGLTGREAEKLKDDASAAAFSLEGLFDEFVGANNKPVRRRVALGFSIFRAQQTSAKLGSAVLSVGGDYGMMMHTAGFNGLNGVKVMQRYVSMLNPANTADRAQAARHVLISDQWADSHAAQWRQLGEEIAHEGSRRLATSVLRVSGLVAHTDIARQAFGMEMVSHITHMRDRSFDNLDPAFARMLQRYDIGESEWNTLRSLQPDTHKGTDWIYPETAAKSQQQKIADNYMRMIVTEADYAVPMPDLRTRAFIGQLGGRRGTWAGEIVKSAFLFKGFPLTVMNMHGGRMLDEGLRATDVGGIAGMFVMRYAVSLLALTTLGGALSLGAKELSKGRDPMAMLSEDGYPSGRFLGAALAQGGGLGIIGDLIYNSSNQFGGGVADTLVGPQAQIFDNLYSLGSALTVNQLDNDPENDDHWRRAAVKIALSETPGISLWQTRLILDRTLGDMMTEWAYGEKIQDRYKRLDEYAAERGTQYYAPPGGRFDWRAPDLGNAMSREAMERSQANREGTGGGGPGL